MISTIGVQRAALIIVCRRVRWKRSPQSSSHRAGPAPAPIILIVRSGRGGDRSLAHTSRPAPGQGTPPSGRGDPKRGTADGRAVWTASASSPVSPLPSSLPSWPTELTGGPVRRSPLNDVTMAWVMRGTDHRQICSARHPVE